MGPVIGILLLLAQVFFAVSLCSAETKPGIASIFKLKSTPADSIYGLSLLVLAVAGFIFAFAVGLPAWPGPNEGAVESFQKRGQLQ